MVNMFENKQLFKKAFVEKLMAMQGKSVAEASSLDRYKTLGAMVREQAMIQWAETKRLYRKQDIKQVYYFSMEYLLGRLLLNNLVNLGILELCREGLAELGVDINDIVEQEPDAGLGNGGLGRLAACFLDSLASLALPGHGIGIRYRYGLFEQRIINGRQVELPENWLTEGNAWEIRRPEEAVEVKFGGQVRCGQENGRLVFYHDHGEVVRAVPYDIPVIGYRNRIVNTLRLWNAELVDADRCAALGCYRSLVEYKHAMESITQLLYPDDSTDEGKIMRLRQQYFLVSAGLQNIVRRYKQRYGTLADLHKRVAIHVNDTHPVLAIPELMRILMDEEGMGWEQAWDITTAAVSYTNHTTLAEALEKWPVELFKPLLPRMYMIIEEIDRRFQNELLQKYSPCSEMRQRIRIIAGGQVKMAHLAIVGSHSVNGVARLHTEILKRQEMKDFWTVFPHKFNNKTNGIAHRRWLLQANPELASLVTSAIGPAWIRQPEKLADLLPFAGEAYFQEKIAAVKRRNKEKLARIIQEENGIAVDVNSLFDVHIKRLHLYKRQLLNAIHIMDLYNRLVDDPELDLVPRTFIFGAKAFPNYYLAKEVIRLINLVAAVINRDRRVKDKIRVVFMENYRVSLAERIIPAADLSEQISMAGKEASGTGNMKFMLNGALTIGTQDGANIEIMEAVGRENIFIFGLDAGEIARLCAAGEYRSWDLYRDHPRLKAVLDQLVNGFLGSKDEFRSLYDYLLTYNDEFFVLKDFDSYCEAQQAAAEAYRDFRRWNKMCIYNIAKAGKFSSDLTIARYAAEIWGIRPVESDSAGFNICRA